MVREAKGLLRDGDGQQPIIRVRDNVRAVDDDGTPAWCTVDRIWVVTEVEGGSDRETIWVWPRWWWPTAGTIYRDHPIRHTKYVQRREETQHPSPVPATQLRFQVMVLHSCNRVNGLHNRRGVSTCRVYRACPIAEHQVHELESTAVQCTQPDCSERAVDMDVHSIDANTWYEVFERQNGYSGSTLRTRTARDWHSSHQAH